MVRRHALRRTLPHACSRCRWHTCGTGSPSSRPPPESLSCGTPEQQQRGHPSRCCCVPTPVSGVCMCLYVLVCVVPGHTAKCSSGCMQQNGTRAAILPAANILPRQHSGCWRKQQGCAAKMSVHLVQAVQGAASSGVEQQTPARAMLWLALQFHTLCWLTVSCNKTTPTGPVTHHCLNLPPPV